MTMEEEYEKTVVVECILTNLKSNLPVNHTNDAQSDRNDPAQQNLQSIRPRIHQVQLTHDQQSSMTWPHTNMKLSTLPFGSLRKTFEIPGMLLTIWVHLTCQFEGIGCGQVRVCRRHTEDERVRVGDIGQNHFLDLSLDILRLVTNWNLFGKKYRLISDMQDISHSCLNVLRQCVECC